MLDADQLPLAGTVVLDFSQFLAGPVAALRLADLGARVIKIERPVTGEIGRTLAFAGRWADGDTLSFHAMNRNKEALVADLKNPHDLQRIRELIERVDVMIHNFRPGVMERIGLDFESVAKINPGLVYASGSGYGPTGPWATRPGQDLLAQSLSAMPWLSANGERPVPVGLAIADHLMSCHIAEGVTALLVRKARTGRGGLVETSLLEGMLDLQFEVLTARLNDDQPATGTGTHCASRAPSAPHGIYPTLDGHLALAMTPDDDLSVLLDSAPGPELDDLDSQHGCQAERESQLADSLRRRTTEHWLKVLDAAGICCGPVLDLEALLTHPGLEGLEMIQTIERPPRTEGGGPIELTTSRSPIRIDHHTLASRRGSPRLGAQGNLADGADPLTTAPGHSGWSAGPRQSSFNRPTSSPSAQESHGAQR